MNAINWYNVQRCLNHIAYGASEADIISYGIPKLDFDIANNLIKIANGEHDGSYIVDWLVGQALRGGINIHELIGLELPPGKSIQYIKDPDKEVQLVKMLSIKDIIE